MGQGPAKSRRQAKRLSIADMLRARPASIRLLATAGSRLKNSRARRPPPRPPRKPPPPPPPPPAASASAAAAEPPPNNSGEDGKTNVEWLLSAERTAHLEHNEKWIMRIGVFFTGLAIASFTWTKWEVEKRLKDELNDEERKEWYAGTYDHERAVFTREQAKLIEERGLPQVSVDGFVPAASFGGPREGMVYKKDTAGLGYYVDQPLFWRRHEVATSSTDAPRAAAAAAQENISVVTSMPPPPIPIERLDGSRAP